MKVLVAIWLAYITTLAAAGALTTVQNDAPSNPSPWRVLDDGTLVFEHGLDSLSFTLSRELIPDRVLRLLKLGIEFAIVNGATEKVGDKDLFHAHLLFLTSRPASERTLRTVDALLLHAQETTFISEETFKRRNIFVSRDAIHVLPCNFSFNDPAKHKLVAHCVSTAPRGYAGSGKELYFTDVSGVPPQILHPYQHNVIVVFGRFILVGEPSFPWKPPRGKEGNQ